MRQFTKALTALPYVRIGELTSTFNESRYNPDLLRQLIPLYEYFFVNYLSEVFGLFITRKLAL